MQIINLTPGRSLLIFMLIVVLGFFFLLTLFSSSTSLLFKVLLLNRTQSHPGEGEPGRAWGPQVFFVAGRNSFFCVKFHFCC